MLSLSYLEKAPSAYLCSYKDDAPGAEMQECSNLEDLCQDNNLASFMPDREHADYYENFFNKFELHCEPSWKI